MSTVVDEKKEIQKNTIKTNTNHLSDGFKSNVVGLCELCVDIVKALEEKGIKSEFGSGTIKMAIVFVKMLNSRDVISTFIENSNEKWEEFSKKDDVTLTANLKTLFKGLPENCIEAILVALTNTDSDGNPLITKDNREEIWDYLTELVKISIIYIHENRVWGILPSGKNGYSKKFMSGISVKKNAAFFDMKIDYSVA